MFNTDCNSADEQTNIWFWSFFYINYSKSLHLKVFLFPSAQVHDKYIKIFLRSYKKSPKLSKKTFFFDPPENEKLSVQKVPLYKIYGDFLHLKLICTHQAHQNSPKPHFYFNKTGFWRVLVCLMGANQF